MSTAPAPPPGPQRGFVFVGGPADGDLRQMELDYHGMPYSTWRVILAPSGRTPLYQMDPLELRAMQLKTYEYRLEYVKDLDGREFGLYVGHDVTNVFERLLSNYKPNKESKRG